MNRIDHAHALKEGIGLPMIQRRRAMTAARGCDPRSGFFWLGANRNIFSRPTSLIMHVEGWTARWSQRFRNVGSTEVDYSPSNSPSWFSQMMVPRVITCAVTATPNKIYKVFIHIPSGRDLGHLLLGEQRDSAWVSQRIIAAGEKLHF